MSRPLAFFDVDGTLVAGDCGVIFTRFCLRRGLLGLPELGAAAEWILRALTGRIDEPAVEEAKRVALRFQMRLGEERSAALLEECFETEILPRRRRDVLDELARLREAGDVVLVTANMRDFALRWGRHLGLPAEVCHGAEGARREGRLTGQLANAVPIAEERARLVRALMHERGVDRASTRAFGDSIFDVPMLRSVGEPVAVYPARGLRAIARREGWRIVG